MGTPAYMAPEAILGDSKVDRRVDVYAMGCVAYFLLTGEPVFGGDTPMKMLMQHLKEAPIPPSHRSEQHIPADIDDLILRCLHKDRSRRPRNAEELFERAAACRIAGTWDQRDARKWWETHLPQLTICATVPPSGPEAGSSRFAVQSAFANAAHH